MGTAAADATLELLADGQVLARIAAQGEKLQAGISEVLADSGISHHIKGPGAMFGIMFMEDEAWEFRDVRHHNAALYEAIAMELVARGVIPDPDGREPWFLCAAHDDTAIQETLEILAEAVHAVKDTGLLEAAPAADAAE